MCSDGSITCMPKHAFSMLLVLACQARLLSGWQCSSRAHLLYASRFTCHISGEDLSTKTAASNDRNRGAQSRRVPGAVRARSGWPRPLRAVAEFFGLSGLHFASAPRTPAPRTQPRAAANAAAPGASRLRARRRGPCTARWRPPLAGEPRGPCCGSGATGQAARQPGRHVPEARLCSALLRPMLLWLDVSLHQRHIRALVRIMSP